MYLALFLSPWMLMYALSTIVMNHGNLFRSPPRVEKEREMSYKSTLPPDARPTQMAHQILGDLGMDGMHGFNRRPDGRLTIVRQDPLIPRRITFTPADGKLVVERQKFRMVEFLNRMHRRRGYQHPYGLDKTWAASVDLVVISMVFWVASGLWMWWELRVTRRLGALAVATGVILFAIYLVTI